MPRDEQELMQQYLMTKDPLIREEIILRFTPLVHFVLGRLGLSRSRNSDYDDLESQGLLGLIEAVDHYRPDLGARISTYATLKIRSKVLDYLRELDWLPRTARQRVRMVQDGIAHLEGILHRVPSDEELADYLHMDMGSLQQAMMDSSHKIISLDEDQKDGDDETQVPLQERLVDTQQANPSEEFEENDLNRQLVNVLKNLPEREQLVLSLYYYEELTFKEIGKVLDISESRVCQIHGRAVMNLKVSLDGTRQAKKK